MHSDDKGQPAAAPPGVGHNKPPQSDAERLAEFTNQMNGIVFSEHSATKKLLLLGIRLSADHKTLGGAYPSYATLMRAASVKDQRTVSKDVHELVDEGILARQDRNGQSPIYGISRAKLEGLIAEHVARLKQKKRGYTQSEPPSSHVGGSAEQADQPPSSHVGGRPAEPPPSHVPPTWEPPPSHGGESTLSMKGGNGAAATLTPHLNDAGFIISAEHQLVVPMRTVVAWRDRFPHIPDLEAEMTGLAAIILAKGRMHPGWTCPDGWMVKPLSNINQEHADRKQVAAARIARAKSAGAPPARGKSRRAEIDEA